MRQICEARGVGQTGSGMAWISVSVFDIRYEESSCPSSRGWFGAATAGRRRGGRASASNIPMGITPPLRGSQRSPQASRWGEINGSDTRQTLERAEPRRLYGCAGGGGPGVGCPPPHQPSPGGSASATPPQGGSDWSMAPMPSRFLVAPPSVTGSMTSGSGAPCRGSDSEPRRPGT